VSFHLRFIKLWRDKMAGQAENHRNAQWLEYWKSRKGNKARKALHHWDKDSEVPEVPKAGEVKQNQNICVYPWKSASYFPAVVLRENEAPRSKFGGIFSPGPSFRA
jgi:hypothetical protein